jgi:hypothetical protein
MKWRTAQAIAFGSLYIAVIVLAFSLGQRHYYGLPLVALLYLLHWRWQGVAFAIDYRRSEQFVAMVKFRRSTTDPNF